MSCHEKDSRTVFAPDIQQKFLNHQPSQRKSAGRRGKKSTCASSDAKPEIWDLNIVDDQRLSVTFDYVKLTNVDTISLKDATGKITAEIE
jgi:hypothetical protein